MEHYTMSTPSQNARKPPSQDDSPQRQRNPAPAQSSSLIQQHNPAVPYAADFTSNGGLFPGKAILIKGVVLPPKSSAERIVIELCCGQLICGDHQDDKALHINPRFDTAGQGFLGLGKADTDIVLNSLINNQWGPEQRCANVMAVGKPFSIRILVLADYFKVAVNGRHLCDYIHRVPWERIRLLYITGCCRLDVVEYQGSLETTHGTGENAPGGTGINPTAPQMPMNANVSIPLREPIVVTKPRIPFVQTLPNGGFIPPRRINLIFTPRMNATRFDINVLQGGEHLFHMRVDFPRESGEQHQGAVVRNSTWQGEWLREERGMWGRGFPFHGGITVDVGLEAGADYVKVWIDGEQFTHFVYRAGAGGYPCVKGEVAELDYPIAQLADQFTMAGDVTVQKFELSDY